MDKSQEIKEMIKQKYGEIALQDKKTSCCGSACCSTEAYVLNGNISNNQV